jgi:NACHT domain
VLDLFQMLEGAVDARGDRVKPIAPGTRVALIERLNLWARSRDSGDQIFWLQDKAGTGKSALASHMARQWHMEGVLAGRFFFNQNGGRNLRRLDRFCVTLARELSENYPAARGLLIEALDEHSARTALSFKEMFEILLTSVVERVSEHLNKPLIFVIDALDECAEDDIQLLMTTLLSGPSNTNSVRFFLTSRPTNEMTAILDTATKVSGKGVVLLDVKSGDAVRDHDVTVFVRHALKGFSTAEQDIVIECAKGVFLWATLACETLQRTVTPTKVLRKLQSNTPDTHMSTLYETVLEAALPRNPSSRDLQLMRSVLQGVTLTCMPISIFSIQSFFPKQKNFEVDGQEYVEYFVKNLGSIMKDGTPYLPIYLLHPTFREFIESQKQDAKFYISPPAGHNNIAMACLDLLSGLTRDVLGLDTADSPIPTHLSTKRKLPARLSLETEAPFRYALIFWAAHAALALGEDETLKKRINSFLESSFLAWVEWSSALKELSETIDGLRLLRQSARVHVALQESEMVSSRHTVMW